MFLCRTLRENGNRFLVNRSWIMKLYFLTSLSLWVQSCPLPPATPLAYPYLTKPEPPQLLSHACPSLSAALAAMAMEIWILPSQALKNFIYIASYGGGRCLLHACVECRLMGVHDIGEWEKAVVPGRMIFCSTGLCLDPCQGSNTETKHQASSCSMKTPGKHG